MSFVILGSGFASLKLATQISSGKREDKNSIALISAAEDFIFLLLIPNKLGKSLGKCSLSTNISSFYKYRNINFIKATVEEIVHQQKIIQTSNGQFGYDLLFDGRGSILGENIYDKWDSIIKKINSN